MSKEIKVEDVEAVEKFTPKKRKWHMGDRSDGRRIMTLPPIQKIMPFMMQKRSDAQNTYADSIDITKLEKFCREQVKAGNSNFGFLHILLAAYVRAVSQRPGLNRFVSGQRIFARKDITVIMAIKKELTVDGVETMLKARFDPSDTVLDVYEKFNKIVQESVATSDESSFDSATRIFTSMPRFFLRGVVRFLNFLDYHGMVPKFLLEVSPFHGSMILTSMGSLGINPIYHHIYDFGNLPMFISYGRKRTVTMIEKDGTIAKHKYVDIKIVIDERTCDGYYFASSFKMLKSWVENPERLLEPPEQIFEDLD